MKLKILTMTVLTAAFFHYGNLLLAEWNGGNAQIIPASIYGDDDRQDVADSDAKMQALSSSAVALFLESSLSTGAKTGSYSLPAGAGTLGSNRGMAPGQRFTDQVQGAYCSGALVGDDLIFTAGHCLKESIIGNFDCAKDKLVFGFAVTKKDGSAPTEFAKKDVYGCKQIVSWKLDAKTKTDYAVLKLDRKVEGRVPLAINRGDDLKVGDKLFVIGYPDGLPIKVAGGAKVRSLPAGAPYFFTDLDTFHGNSGSPVFNAKTFRIEGILVRGDNDYVNTSSGTKTDIFPQELGAGEEVTKISEIKNLLPVTLFEKYLNYAEKEQRKPAPVARPVPAIYFPGSNGPSVQPAVYYPEPAPTRVEAILI
ncbi:MAG: serine protease [Elusimicrobia bacterium]|nr:serine protease [Elusimicrobiota bacterium]